MSEIPGFRSETEPSAEPPLDKSAILNNLFEAAGELGVDVGEGDVEGLLGEDDNDFLGNLTSLAILNDVVDLEYFYRRLGIPVEDSGETE